MCSAANQFLPYDDRPRVALVAHDVHDQGGMERACAELIRHSYTEIAFTVVAGNLAHDLRPLVERWVRIRVPARPFPVKFAAFFIRAGFALRRLDVDLIHTVGAIVPNRADVAAIHFCHQGHRQATGRLAPGSAPLLRRFNTTLARVLALLAERWCYRAPRLRSFAAVSNGVAEEIRAHYPGIPVAITPNGVDTSCFRPDVAQRMAMREHLGIEKHQCVALFVGGDWNRKGLELVLEGVTKARSEGADVVLWVVGPGDEARFRAKSSALGISDVTLFFGTRSDTECFYQAADVFVFPSAYETFSIVCFEAAASGLPLIISPLHGASELVGKNEGGFIVDRTAVSLASALVTFTEDPALRCMLGAEALRRAQSFTWKASAASLVVAYHQLVSRASS